MGSERLGGAAAFGRPISSFTVFVRSDNRKILTLTGRRDVLSDGVWDYCSLLSNALRPLGFDAELRVVKWERRGWFTALRELRTQLFRERYEWALLQYTSIAWSRRGFPFGVLAVACVAKRCRTRLAVVFHESSGFRASGVWARIRFACQQWIIHKLFSLVDVGIFTVPLEKLYWLGSTASKAHFVPIGSNIPENLGSRQRDSSISSPKTVAVFCVTNLWRTKLEVAEIAAAVLQAKESVQRLRLIVFGRGAMEARSLLQESLAHSGIELSVLGVLPPGEITRILSSSDVLLYVRSPLTPQHGSALAAVACGLPLVAYGDETACFPLNEAGIMLVRPGDGEALGRALEQVLTDNALWLSLHQRCLDTYKKYFAWEEIALTYARALQAPAAAEPEALSQGSQDLEGPGGAPNRLAANPAKERLRASEVSDST